VNGCGLCVTSHEKKLRQHDSLARGDPERRYACAATDTRRSSVSLEFEQQAPVAAGVGRARRLRAIGQVSIGPSPSR
jgi:hypothetical protein